MKVLRALIRRWWALLGAGNYALLYGCECNRRLLRRPLFVKPCRLVGIHCGLHCWCGQVAEGVATAGVVVGLARKYRVSLPVLTAVAQVLDNNLTAREAVFHIMNLPQIEEA